jgi:ribosomal protein L11 methyltransferase
MYIWRKRVTSDWLRRRGDDLNRRFPGTVAIVQRPGKRAALVEVSFPSHKDALQMIREFGGSAKKLPRDWLQSFAKRARTNPLRIGARLIVLGSPDQELPTLPARPIVVPAEAAFGTGEHATTAMCLRLLERQTRKRRPGWSVLDAGTGSGILALAARCFGATRVLAIDNDPVACAIAARNARANRISKIEFLNRDVLKLKLKQDYDVITANLFSELLIAALPKLARHLASCGLLIVSGILRTQEKAVATALRRNSFSAQEIRRRGKWVALLAIPSRKASLPRKNS